MEGGKRCTDFGDHYNPYGVSSNIYFFEFSNLIVVLVEMIQSSH